MLADAMLAVQRRKRYARSVSLRRSTELGVLGIERFACFSLPTRYARRASPGQRETAARAAVTQVGGDPQSFQIMSGVQGTIGTIGYP